MDLCAVARSNPCVLWNPKDFEDGKESIFRIIKSKLNPEWQSCSTHYSNALGGPF